MTKDESRMVLGLAHALALEAKNNMFYAQRGLPEKGVYDLDAWKNLEAYCERAEDENTK